MRKIEKRIIDALRDQSQFHSGNTTVEQVPKCGQVSIMHCEMVGQVFLHGNLIATYDRALNQLDIEDGGWESVTTKSRLNALLSEFAPAYRIIQKNHKWYIDNLSCEISENVKHKDILIPWEGSATFRAGSMKG